MTVKKQKEANGITFGMISVIIISMSIILILALLKVYLSNQIYYESKEVNKMQREVQALKAERVILQQNVEALNFKNKVADTIFVLSDG